MENHLAQYYTYVEDDRVSLIATSCRSFTPVGSIVRLHLCYRYTREQLVSYIRRQERMRLRWNNSNVSMYWLGKNLLTFRRMLHERVWKLEEDETSAEYDDYVHDLSRERFTNAMLFSMRDIEMFLHRVTNSGLNLNWDDVNSWAYWRYDFYTRNRDLIGKRLVDHVGGRRGNLVKRVIKTFLLMRLPEGTIL